MKRFFAVACTLGIAVTAGPASAQQRHFRHVCSDAPPGYAACAALVMTDQNGVALVSGSPSGYGPADIQSAYSLPNTGSGQTVYIVDAYDDLNAESDLAAYRSYWGLTACTSQNRCFKKLNQHGGTKYPKSDFNWGLEESLDLDAVSATCPNCNIVLIESRNNYIKNLLAANTEALKLGGQYISNSWFASEFKSEKKFDKTFDYPGVDFTFASGDSGYGTAYPAASPDVTSVGGTTLVRGGGTRGWTETVWSGTGSGCSQYEGKPSWQTDTGCNNRTDNDVAAVADPNTGLAVYDTFGYGGWLQLGGTSLATPLIASVYALAGNASSTNFGSYSYSNTGSLNDVIAGSNGSCAPNLYLCTGGVGYDGPTGNGTPNGTGGF